MKVLTIASLRGGVGKTTTALALATEFAEMGPGHNIVLFDSDPQATGTITFGLAAVQEPWAEKPVRLHLKNLRRGSITLVRSGRSMHLASAEELDAFFVREGLEADLAIIDTGPGEIDIVDYVIGLSDLVLCPITTGPTTLAGLVDVMHLVEAYDPAPPVRALITKVNTASKNVLRQVKNVRDIAPGTLIDISIPLAAVAEQADEKNIPVTLFDRSATPSQAYARLARLLAPDLLGIAPEKKRKGKTPSKALSSEAAA